ncbi:MAG: ribonuclease III [SAR324 cluster bacterium]|uniref:Ribonuclease 3 n=1 Tax=SAR324 cluster bacterium TaxID=2024889 RepID=A0A7X9ILI1_9DELT|nr:ribonuclease III [SAR324 cluster bacterium]
MSLEGEENKGVIDSNEDINALVPEKQEYEELEAKLQYKFLDINWLKRALTHRSLHVGGASGDYERLEFLGDAVLDLAVAHMLLDLNPDLKEGDLSKMRAALVNTSSLASLAREINIGPFIRLSRGELANGGAERPSILADVVEAIFGAIYRESGYEEALKSAKKLFEKRVKCVKPVDPKTELQEYLHTLGLGAPEYLLDLVEGPEHAPTFVSSVLINGECKGRGRASSKKGSQQAAAAEALQSLMSAKNKEEECSFKKDDCLCHELDNQKEN